MSTHIASLVIRDDPSTLQPTVAAPQRSWSLSLVVGGAFYKIGESAYAYNEHEAAQIFARALSQRETEP